MHAGFKQGTGAAGNFGRLCQRPFQQRHQQQRLRTIQGGRMAAKQGEGRGMNADDLTPEGGQIKVSLDDFRLAPTFFNFAAAMICFHFAQGCAWNCRAITRDRENLPVAWSVWRRHAAACHQKYAADLIRWMTARQSSRRQHADRNACPPRSAATPWSLVKPLQDPATPACAPCC